MVQYAKECLCDVIAEIEPLLELHYRELAKNQHLVKLKPDWAKYADIEAAGGLYIWTARSDGVLIGYSFFYVSKHPHYMDLVLASNDVLFLTSEHRTGRTGVRFIQYCEDEIQKAFGAGACIAWHAKEGTTLHKMLGRMGYGVQDIVFTKLLR